MSLRTRLILVLLGCGIVPLVVVGLSNYSTANHGMNSISDKARQSLTNSAEEQLTALREVKKQQIVDYFETIRKQIQTFSENKMVVDALSTLRPAFREFQSNAQIEGDRVKELRDELYTYYANEFSAEYKNQNAGNSPDVKTYFDQLDDEAVVLQHAYIRANEKPLGSKHELDTAAADVEYNRIHKNVHPVIRHYLEEFGYYDIFLVDTETGDIVYSVFKELDFGTSLLDGPVAKTNFGEAFRKANQLAKGEFVLVDFKQYMPSYEAPASFIASPVFNGETRIGVAMFQMPLDTINGVMGETSGLGETGETILIGPDHLMRSNSRRDPENRSVVASFKNPAKGAIDSMATKNVFDKGEAGFLSTTDYAGNEAVIAYTPIEILGLNWCLQAKKDTSEILASLKVIDEQTRAANSTLIFWTLGLMIVIAVAIFAVAYFTALQISKPIQGATEYAKTIAAGDLSKRCEINASGEVGELVGAMNEMRDGLAEIISKLSNNSTVLSNSSHKLLATANQLAQGAKETTDESTTVSASAEEMSVNMKSVSTMTAEMSDSVRSVSAAVEEMTACIGEIANNAETSAKVADEAARLTKSSSEKVSQLGNAADEIGKVIEVIQDIAEQTNLLALNATIEAARAGDAGKGFAVVANEVKDLAKQTASATDDISKRIQAIQDSSKDVVTVIDEIDGVIRNVNEVSRTIASAVEEQRVTTSEISKSLSASSATVESVNQGISESATASREITENMVKVDSAAKQTSIGATETQDAGGELLSLAEELQQLVAEFKTDSVAAEVSEPTAA